jgi:hypothetical protein
MHLAQRIALTDTSFPSQVRQKFEGPHQELIKIGFLKSVRDLRKGNSTILRYTMAAKSEWKPVRKRVHLLPPAEHPLVREMTGRGITGEVAEALLKEHDEKSIADQLEVFDHLRAEQSPMVTKNPAGFLRSSIEKNFAPPTGYVSRAERARRKQVEQEARQKEADEAREANEAFAQRRDRLDAVWTSLNEAERARLEADALALLNPFALKCYTKEKADHRIGAGHQTLRSEIEQLLETRLSAVVEPAV